MQLTWRQVGAYVSILASVAVALIGLLLYGSGVAKGVTALWWMVLIGEAVWYAIWCTWWNKGNGAQTWLMDLITMFAARGVLGMVVAALISAVAEGETFAFAFQQAYYGRLPLAILQVAMVPLILYFPLFLPRLHPVAETVTAQPQPQTAAVRELMPALQFNPYDPRASSLEGILSMLSARAARSGGLVFGEEGLPVANNLPAEVSAEHLAAYGAELVPSLQDLAEKVGVGRVGQITINSEAGTLTMVPSAAVTLVNVLREPVEVSLSSEQAAQLRDTLRQLWSARYGD